MKAILEFQLPDEEAEYRLALRAGLYHSALCDLSNIIRNQVKYGDLGKEAVTVLQELQQRLHESLEEEVL